MPPFSPNHQRPHLPLVPNQSTCGISALPFNPDGLTLKRILSGGVSSKLQAGTDDHHQRFLPGFSGVNPRRMVIERISWRTNFTDNPGMSEE